MDHSEPNRRDFHKLAMAALGGIVAGAGVVHGDAGSSAKKNDKTDLMLQEPHVCRGLNTCKNKGKGGKNACAGQGNCATAKAHSCKGDNDCKGLGGCGEEPGENSCKGQGGCAVPLEDDGWSKARKHFEKVMAKAHKKVGAAPAKE